MYTSRRSTLIIIALILLAASTYVLFASRAKNLDSQEDQVASTTTETNTPSDADASSVAGADGTPVTFTSEDNVAVTVSFSGEVAILNGLGYTNARLMQARSASGARYENADGLEVWNKGNEVTISKDGTIIFVGTAADARAGTPELAGSTWLLQSITKEDGETVVPPRVEIFTITFGTDGRLSGTTDCNNFGGGYTFKDGVLTLGAVAQTLMFCEGSQEQEFIATLKTGSVGVSFKNANTIVLKAPEAKGSLTLVREEE